MRPLINFVLIALCMPVFVMGAREVQKYLGITPVPVPVVGTGSMYPSLYWSKEEGGPDDTNIEVVDERRTNPHMYRLFEGIYLFGKKYFERSVGYGDMVAFQSEATAAVLVKEGKDPASGFIKRVIGVPGDQIELRDGFVYVNGQELSEPYIFRPRSTFGDATVSDCRLLTLSPDSYLVLGDNRKVSADSRGELGFVKLQDITYVLPYNQQDFYRSLWRDPSQDQELAGTPSLDKNEFYRLLNQTRQNEGLPALRPLTALEKSAALAAGGVTLESSMAQSSYQNILTSQFSVSGRFTAPEMLENLLYFDNTKRQVLDPKMTDIGIADVATNLEGCPGEIIVGQLGGYIPAEYNEDMITSWRQLRDNLREIIPSWEKAVEYDFLDQAKLQELLSIYRRRLSLATEVVAVMEANEWLTDDQEARMEADSDDAKRATQIASELNGE